MHHGGHPIQILAELLLLALGKVVMVCVLVFIASCFVALGLAIGGVIFSLFGRKRHLFWALPLANFLVYLSLHRVLNNRMSTDKISFLDQFHFPLVESTILAFLVLTLLGWVSAILLTPLQWLLRSVKSSQEQTTTDENQVLHEYLRVPGRCQHGPLFRRAFGLRSLDSDTCVVIHGCGDTPSYRSH